MANETSIRVSSSAADLRALVAAAGLNARVRTGKGCRLGKIHLFARIDATAADREAIANFLRSVDAVSTFPLATTPGRFFDSCSVSSFSCPGGSL